MTAGATEKNGGMKRTHKLPPTVVANKASIEMMQRLLMLLIHALKCPHVPSTFATFGSLKSAYKVISNCCPIYTQCKSVKELCRHIKHCPHNQKESFRIKSGQSCHFPGCSRSRYSLWHFKHCGEGEACPLCGPVNLAIAKEAEVLAKYWASLPPATPTHLKHKHKEEPPLKRRRVRYSSSVSPSHRMEEGKVGGNSKRGEVVESSEEHQAEYMNAETTSKCFALLRNMLDHENGWVFSSPVDPILLNIPDYYDVVKRPMDLGTIENHLRSGAHYRNAQEFEKDVTLTYDNAILYNLEGTEVYSMAVDMKRKFLLDYQTAFGS